MTDTLSHILKRNLQAYRQKSSAERSAVTEQEFRDDSCLSRFGSRGSDDLQDAQRRFPAQTVLDLLNSERAAGLFHCHVRCLLNFQARGRKYSAVWINKSKSLLQWNMNILYILCDNVLWLIDAFLWI